MGKETHDYVILNHNRRFEIGKENRDAARNTRQRTGKVASLHKMHCLIHHARSKQQIERSQTSAEKCKSNPGADQKMKTN